MSTVPAHYDGKNFVPDLPVDLEPGTKVDLDFRVKEGGQADAEWLRKVELLRSAFKDSKAVPFNRGDVYP